MQTSIILSLGIFHAWLEKVDSTTALNSSLKEVFNNQVVQGAEFDISFRELDSWANLVAKGRKVLPKRFQGMSQDIQSLILKSKTLSIHLDSFEHLDSGKEEWLGKILQQLYLDLGVKSFTLHPDSVSKSRWVKILENLPSQVTLSIENMDSQKSCFQSLTEVNTLLKNYPKLSCTFDWCHWLETSKTFNLEEVESFFCLQTERIDKVHFSIPSTSSKSYRHFNKLESKHYLNFDSQEFPEFPITQIGNNVIWVIEGSVPAWNKAHLLGEINLIRELCSSQQIREAA